jgi:hypothetical protein
MSFREEEKDILGTYLKETVNRISEMDILWKYRPYPCVDYHMVTKWSNVLSLFYHKKSLDSFYEA